MSQEKETRAASSHPLSQSPAYPADLDDEEEQWDVGKPSRNGGARRGGLAEEGEGVRRAKKSRKTREPRS